MRRFWGIPGPFLAMRNTHPSGGFSTLVVDDRLHIVGCILYTIDNIQYTIDNRQYTIDNRSIIQFRNTMLSDRLTNAGYIDLAPLANWIISGINGDKGIGSIQNVSGINGKMAVSRFHSTDSQPRNWFTGFGNCL